MNNFPIFKSIFFDCLYANLIFILESEYYIWFTTRLLSLNLIYLLAPAFFGVLLSGIINYTIGYILRGMLNYYLDKRQKPRNNSLEILERFYAFLWPILILFGWGYLFFKVMTLFAGITKSNIFKTVFLISAVRVIYYSFY
ncbi:MAG: hypothetical protein SFT68_00010 [Rickettsiaceae bacterium]|nr:hypothetical protein [Rickettsiaceae bacterium]